MFKKFYIVFSVMVLLFYGSAMFLGWEMGTSRRQVLPADMRNGGYRSFHFWHGGK